VSLLAQDERLTRRVGTIALALIAAAIAFFVFVKDRIELGSPIRIKVYFHHSAGLVAKSTLVVGGEAIGKVEAIENVPRGGNNPLKGEIGTVAIVAIDGDEAWKVRADAVVFVSHGPLSAKYLEIAPPRRDAEPGAPIADGAELLGIDPPMLDVVFNRAWRNMSSFRAFAEAVGPEVDALRAEIGKLRSTISSITPPAGALGLYVEAKALVAEAERLYDVGLGGDFGVAAFRSLVAQARGTFAQLRVTLDKIQPLASRLDAEVTRIRGSVAAHDPVGRIEATIARARAVLDQVEPLLAKVDDISGRLARGEGSLGLLMKDPEFPEDAKELGKILKRQPWKVIAKPEDN
jgi:phospholipid/cholesterol/gamma-HCH transport system substrate-binding protein